MCEKEVQLIAIMCLFDFVCGTQNLASSFDFQEGHLDNPVACAGNLRTVHSSLLNENWGYVFVASKNYSAQVPGTECIDLIFLGPEFCWPR